ncbi:MAG: hypothetical protein HC901_03520 [Bdellovibrionaceae bacterium]|nr:hypothetical protein [Pseudobdellovibrionaceae bacterium]
MAGHADKIPPVVDGGSMREALFDPDAGRVKRNFEGLFFHVGRYFRGYFVTPHSAYLLGDYKFILEYDSKDNGGAKRWLYNLKDDIGEKNNLMASMPEKAAEMERALMKCLHAVDAEIPAPHPDYSGKNPYVPIAGDF